MIEILRYIIEHCAFLLAPGGYRFIDSRVYDSFGGDAYLILSSDSLKLRFVRDRAQLFLDLQGPNGSAEEDWYSIDIVQRYFTGETRDTAELDAEYAAFLEANLSNIEQRFGSDSIGTTAKELSSLRKAQAKELFG
jgi:hypothetical protein